MAGTSSSVEGRTTMVSASVVTGAIKHLEMTI
jgi:hypothetical protein